MADPKNIIRIIDGDSSRSIPKYCNGVLINKLTDGSVVLTFVHREAALQGDGKSEEKNTIIERILVDTDHLQKIIEAINNFSNTDEY